MIPNALHEPFYAVRLLSFVFIACITRTHARVHAQAHACARSHISASDGHAKTEKTSFAYNVTDSEDESSSEGEATGQHRALRQEGLLASPLRHFDHGVGASADARFAR